MLSADEEKTLARRIIEHNDPEARDRMVRSNLRLVVNLAKRYMNRGLSLSDLIAEGNLGLLHAVKRFNPEQGNRFSTYASWWIKQAIKFALTNSVQSIHIPNYMVELVNKFKRATGRLSGELLREPTTDELPLGLACLENPEFDLLWSTYVMLRHRLETDDNPRTLEVPDEPTVSLVQFRSAVIAQVKSSKSVNSNCSLALLDRIVAAAGGERGPELFKAFKQVAGEIFPAKKIGKIQKAVKAYGASAQSLLSTESGISLGDMVPDYRTASAEETVMDAGQCLQVRQLLDKLDQREQEVLRMHYGLDNKEPINLREIGLGFKPKLTRERVRQIEQDALQKLEELLNGDENSKDMLSAILPVKTRRKKRLRSAALKKKTVS